MGNTCHRNQYLTPLITWTEIKKITKPHVATSPGGRRAHTNIFFFGGTIFAKNIFSFDRWGKGNVWGYNSRCAVLCRVVRVS
jgi:hypothetical protein